MSLKFYTGQQDYIPKLNDMDAAYNSAMTYLTGSNATPQPLGTATSGVVGLYSRADHVHASTGITQEFGNNSKQYATTEYVLQSASITTTKNITGGVTLSAVEAVSPVINLTGALTANTFVVVPALSRTWLFINSTTGGFTTTIKTPSGNGVAVVQGANRYLYSDGVNVLSTDTDLSGVTLNGMTGGVVSGALSTTSDMTVGGNLTVNGTTTTVNSATVTVKDPVITLGGNTAPTVNDNKDRGVEYRWHNGTSPKIGFFGYKDSTGKLTFIPDATNTAEVFTGPVGTITANIDGIATNVSGTVAVANGGTGATTAASGLSNLGGAPLDSPALTGAPTAPTAASTINTAQVATTSFVQGLRDITGGLVGMSLFKINFKNVANTFTSFFTNSNTAARTYTFQDRDGTIVDGVDLALKANLASPTFTGTPSLGAATATTPAQFDVTTRVATMASMQNAGLHFQNSNGMAISSNTTMALSASGHWAEIQAANLTITLPALATTTGGLTTYTFKCIYATTFKGNGSELIMAGIGNANTYTSTAGETLTMVSNGAGGGWYIMANGLSVPALSAVFAPLASPSFTGTPSLPTGAVGITQVAGTSNTTLATTAFVTTADNLKAPLNNPSFTGQARVNTSRTDKSWGQAHFQAYSPAGATAGFSSIALHVQDVNAAPQIGHDGGAGKVGGFTADGAPIFTWSNATQVANGLIKSVGGHVTAAVLNVDFAPVSFPVFNSARSDRFITTDSYAYRMKTGSGTGGYSSIWYFDGSNTHLMSTALNDADGGYNALRPFYSNASTGDVVIGNGALLVYHNGIALLANGSMFRAAGGNEGGELVLERPPTGATFTGNITVDMSGNNFRIFESGGNARGFYLDITSAANGVGTKIYNQSNARGSVSQSGGVPTGAIIESGANGNGNYTRWADGTQSCSHNILVPTWSAGSSASVTWTYPAGFIETPRIVSTLMTSNPQGYSASFNNATTASALVCAGGTVSSNGWVSVLATGRWF